MSKEYPSQNSFVRGELSPLMGGQSSTQIYSEGLQTLRNMYSDSRGPAKNRESLKRILNLIAGSKAKIETYNRSASEFFTFVFTDLKVHFIRNIDNPVITVLAAPWTEDQVEDIYVVPLPDGRTFYLLHPNVAPYKLIDAVGELVHTTFNSGGNFTVPAGITSVSVCVCGGGGGGGDSVGGIQSASGAGGGGGGSGVVKDPSIVVSPAEVVPVTVGAAGAAGTGLNPGGSGGTSSFAAISGTLSSTGGGGGGAATTGVGGGGGGGGGGSGGGAGGSGGSGGSANGAASASCAAVCGGSTWPGAAGGSQSDNLLAGGGAGGAGGYGPGTVGATATAGASATPNTGAGGGGGSGSGDGGAGATGRIVVTYETAAAGLTLTIVTFVGAPVNWTGTNWPSSGAYHDARMWYANTPNEGETFVGSRSGFPEDLTIGVTDSDAMSFVMENYGAIEWMISTKALIIGTINGEYVVNTDGTPITPSNIQVDQQSAYGSADIQPVKIGDQVIYVTPDRRKVRAINFKERDQNWMSVDLTLYSEHITNGIIRDLSWSQHPNNLLWITMFDGTMACLSYERGDNIQGWHRHDTQGTIIGSGSGFDGDRSVLVVAVTRITGQIDIEALSPDFYMDSWIQTSEFTAYTNANNTDLFYIEGFDHLEGRTVQITIDTAVHSNRVVGAESESGQSDGATGRIYVNYSGSVAVAGLGYVSEIETLQMDGGSPSGSGSGHKKRWNKIYVRVLESGIPLINDERGNDRNDNTPMDSPEAPLTGVVESLNLGWDRGASVNVKQDLPLPLIVLKIFGELKKNVM